MKKYLLLAVLAISFNLNAQVGSYTFRAFSSTFDSLTSPTSDPDVEDDDALGVPIAIGFSFNYDGTNYTHVIASSNGWLSFDTSATANALTNDLDNSSTAIRPLVAPLWDDLSGFDSRSRAGYQTSGTSPNRVFTYEWKNWLWNYNASSPVISFQVKLFEGSNKIEFRYRREAGTINSSSASIGLASASTGTNNFLSLDASSANPGTSSTTETTTISTAPATGQVYEFSPPKNRDAGISQMIGAVCSGSNPVIVALQNYGLDTLRSASIAWSVATNGGTPSAQTNASWSGTLLRGDTAHVNLGNFSFQAGNTYDIEVYSFSPNASNDENNLNDTLLLANFQTGLSGTYTIGGSSPDFTNFTNAIAALESRGVCGAVTFDVRYAAYNEQISLPGINGVSATNTITFRSAPGNTAQPELYFSPAANLYVLEFNGASHIVFDDIFIESLNSSSGRVIAFEGENNHISIQNCRIKSPVSSTTSTNSAVIYDFSGATNHSNNITIEGNTIEGGSYGIYFYGASTSDFQQHLTIRNNEIEDFYYMGVYTYYNAHVEISDNYLEDAGTYTSPYSIRINYSDTSEVFGNRIFNYGASSPYGIYLNFCDGSASKPVMLYNNLVSMANTAITGSPSGIYAYQGENNLIYYNTVVLQSGGTGSDALYVNYLTSHSLDARNNSLVNYGNGYALYVANTAGVDTLDYNNLYSSGTNLAYWSGNRASLAALRAISGKSANSINIDPSYFSAQNLRSYNVDLDGAATPISAVTTDYEGDTRNANTPDIGADEYTPPAIDIAIASVFEADITSCGQTAQTLRAIITNAGTQDQHSIPAVLQITGAITQNISVTYNDTLTSGASDTISFSSFNTLNGGNFDFKVFSAMTGDTVGFNDTLELPSKTINAIPVAPTANGDTVCEGENTILVAQGAFNVIEWYATSSSSTPLIKKDTLSLTNLSQTDTFYVEGYNMTTSSVGANDSTIGSGGSYTAFGDGLVFDVNNEVRIDSLTVYPFSSGNLVVVLQNSQGTNLQTRTISVSSAGRKRVYVGFTVSPGQDYRLVATGTTIRSLFRNSGGAVYPYTDAGNNISIKETVNSLGSSGYYYFFYDWLLTVEGCHSERTPVQVHVNPLPSLNLGADTGFCQGQNFSISLDASNTGATYLWHDNSANPTFTASSFGQYWVEVTSNLGCVASDTFNINAFQKPQANSSVFPDYCESLAPFKFTQGGGAPSGGTGYYLGPGVLSDSLFSPAQAGAGTHSISYVYESGIGCSDTAFSQVTVLPKPSASFASLPNICANANPISLNQGSGTPSGGTGVYFGSGVSSGSFNPGAAGAGNYTITYVYTATNTCVDTATQSIIVDTIPVVSLGLIPSICANEDPELLTQGMPNGGVYSGTGISNNVLDPSLAGAGLNPVTYTFTDGNNCSASAQASVRIHPAPNMSLGPDTVICAGTNLSLSPGSFTTYRWEDGSIVPQRTISIAGTYVLTVTNINGCRAIDTLNVEVEVCSGLDEASLAAIAIYPNPVSNELWINLPSTIRFEQITLLDMQSKVILSRKVIDTTERISLEEIAPGTYFIELQNEKVQLRYRIVKM